MLTIDRHSRDLLRDELANTLSGVSDLRLYAEDNQEPDVYFPPIRRRIYVAVHLLDDLGWGWHGGRDVYYITLPSADLRWWIAEVLDGVEESLREAANCFALAGHVYPPSMVSETLPAERLAASELEEARERSDLELEKRSALMALLRQIETGEGQS